jgi:non-canonical purine NTP pyrophosphatase (RdgB/HAM1 family)
MQSLMFVTSNKGKALEAQSILNIPLDIVALDVDEIQSLDTVKITRKKAEQAFKLLGKPLIVDDVSMFIHAWNGFPGPFIKFIGEVGGSQLLLRMMDQEKDRSARVTASIGYHDGKTIHIFQGTIEGSIAYEIKGQTGFGWDGVFIPDGKELTYAQMDPVEKNSISHRRKALEKFKEFLDKT